MVFSNLRGPLLNAAITVASGAGFLLFGYDQGVFGGILTNNNFLELFDHPSPTVQGQIVATYDIGCIFGCILSMFIGDVLGRRRSILIGCSILIVGAVIQTSANGTAQMIVGRIVAGLGNGLNTTAIPIWQVETAKPSHRGALIVFQLVTNIFGISLTNWMNYGFSYLPNSEVSWRFPLAFQIFFAFLTMFLVLFLPESPRWLILKDRMEEATAITGRLWAKPANDPEVLAEVQMLAENVAHEVAEQRVPVREIFHSGKQQTLRRILLGMGTQFMQQIGGTNVVATYLPVVLTRSFSMSKRLSLILSATVSIWLMIWGAICALFIDNVGRKKLMTYGAFFESICFAMVAAGLAVGSKAMLIVAVVFIYLYYTFYGLSFLSIPFMYPAEINSQRMRNIGTSLSTMTNWCLCYVVVCVTPPGIANLGWRYYLIYAITNMCFVPLVHFFYVETAQLSLEEIDRVFEIKYEGGSSITYKQATKMARACRPLDAEKSDNGIEVDEVEIVGAEEKPSAPN